MRVRRRSMSARSRRSASRWRSVRSGFGRNSGYTNLVTVGPRSVKRHARLWEMCIMVHEINSFQYTCRLLPDKFYVIVPRVNTTEQHMSFKVRYNGQNISKCYSSTHLWIITYSAELWTLPSGKLLIYLYSGSDVCWSCLAAGVAVAPSDTCATAAPSRADDARRRTEDRHDIGDKT